MGFPVSETSLKETSEGRDGVKIRVVKSTVGRDGVSPHQIPHTEIVEGLVKREAGHGPFKDTLRGGIWSAAIPGMMPRAGGSPPDMGIGVDVMPRRNKRTIITRDVGIVTLVLLSIGFGGVAGHLLVWLVSDEGDDGIVPLNHHPLYNLPFSPRCQHSLSVDPSAHRVWPQHFSQIRMPLRSLVIGVIFVLTFCIGDDSRLDGDPHSFPSFSHVIVPLCSTYSLGPSHDSYNP